MNNFDYGLEVFQRNSIMNTFISLQLLPVVKVGRNPSTCGEVGSVTSTNEVPS